MKKLMGFLRPVVFISLGLLTMGVGCISKKKYEEEMNRAAAEKSALEAQFAEIRSQSLKEKYDLNQKLSEKNQKIKELYSVLEFLGGSSPILKTPIPLASSVLDPIPLSNLFEEMSEISELNFINSLSNALKLAGYQSQDGAMDYFQWFLLKDKNGELGLCLKTNSENVTEDGDIDPDPKDRWDTNLPEWVCFRGNAGINRTRISGKKLGRSQYFLFTVTRAGNPILTMEGISPNFDQSGVTTERILSSFSGSKTFSLQDYELRTYLYVFRKNSISENWDLAPISSKALAGKHLERSKFIKYLKSN